MSIEFLRGKSILVTGGTGSFGQRFIETLLLESAASRIIVLSRDELKQSQMQTAFRDHLDRLRFFLGDVRDVSRLQRAFHGVSYVVHAAALKQVPHLEFNPFEAIQTNVIGTKNVIDAAIDQGVEKVILISTDKAANPANLYGATKLCAERLIVSGNVYSAGRTKFSAVRYGNVLGSRGSLLKLIEEQRKTGIVTLTHEEMTRFWITLDQGISLVLRTFERMKGREIFIPKIPSMRVKDLLASLAPECEIRLVGIRPGEKIHETLITPEEARHTQDLGDVYVIRSEFDGFHDGSDTDGEPVPDGFSYTSDRNMDQLTTSRLFALIESVRGQAS